MKLVGSYLSPYARRVAAALVSRDIAFEHHDVNGYHEFEAARRYNPIARVPSLVLDDGEVLIDSTAILDYLNELSPGVPLIPSDSRKRRQTLRLAAIGCGVCEQAVKLFQRGKEVPPAMADRWRAQILGGLQALDRAVAQDGAVGEAPLDAAGITAVVTVEFVARTHPASLASGIPALAAMARRHADTPPFARTRPQP